MNGETAELVRVREFLARTATLELAILVGSRAVGDAHAGSDWDIAIQWPAASSLFDTLAQTETLRRDLAVVLSVTEDRIDLIDLPRAPRHAGGGCRGGRAAQGRRQPGVEPLPCQNLART